MFNHYLTMACFRRRSRKVRTTAIVLCAILMLVAASGLAVQPAGPKATQAASSGPVVAPKDEVVTAEKIEAARKAAETDTTLSDADKQKATEYFDQAGKWLQEAGAVKAELARLEALVKEAPRRVEEIRTRLARPPKEPSPALPAADASDLDQIELALSQEELASTERRESLKKQEDELSRLLVGSKGLSEEIASRSKAVEQIDADLRSQESDEPPAVARGRILALKARRLLRGAELDTLELRLGSLNLLTNLAQAERDLTAAEVARRQPRLDALRETAQQLREERAKGARQEAEELAAKTAALPAAVQQIAEENARYRKELEDLVQREKTVSDRLTVARRGLDEIKTDFERTRERVDVVGASEAIGKMLRRRRDALPSVQKYHRTSVKRGADISQATDRQIEIDELQRELSNIDEVVGDVVAGLPEDLDSTRKALLIQEVYVLVQTRRDALNELQKVYSRYIGQLTALDLAERQLAEVAGSYIGYIDDQLIWMPSTGLTSLAELEDSFLGLDWLLSPANWQQVLKNAGEIIRGRPGLVALFVVAYIALIAVRRHASRRLLAISEKTRKIRTDSFRLTVHALWQTLVLALPWPLLMIAAGWALAKLPSAYPFTVALANGLFNSGLMLGSLSILAQICRPENVGDAHLRWPEPIRADLVRELRWFTPLAVVLGFFVTATFSSEVPVTAQGLGWVVFVLLMLSIAVLAVRLLRQGGAVASHVQDNRGGNGLARVRYLWLPLGAGIPLALALMSALGYHYTAVYFEQRLQLTFWFFIGLFLLKELLLRGLYVAERRLRFEDAVKRREELKAQREQALADGQAPEDQGPPIPLDVPEVNYAELGEQTKRLVRAGYLFGAIIGTWTIWNDLLPALGFLTETALPFDSMRIVDGVAKQVPVTLGDFAVGLLVIVITVLAAKNIPGVLEIALLQRLPLDPGARYAIKSLSQYFIAGVGIVSAFSMIGLQWSKLQWLVAALGVGLGFGLQEIVANFISGIILLFERPIRVGDIVTIDNTTGVVSRIRIRATTITNWDKQELLVPNKEFITGRLINWTLTDKMNRIVITVGVAYGSDVERALALMIEAAAENDNILEDPKPVSTFEGFGDNALTLLLRAYLGSLEFRLATISALHQAINRKFNEAGIVVAFPQRDLHLDTSRPLEIRLNRLRGGGQAPGA